jgi:hypothetical protein
MAVVSINESIEFHDMLESIDCAMRMEDPSICLAKAIQKEMWKGAQSYLRWLHHKISGFDSLYSAW